jgi:penicillin-binding protein 1A
MASRRSRWAGLGRQFRAGMAALRRWLSAHPWTVAIAVLALAALGSLAAGLLVGAWGSVCRDCPSIAQIYVWEPKQSTKIFDHDAKLIAELFEERRTPVEIETLPPHVKYAFVAVEDKRFYRHRGFSVRGVIRAAVMRVPGLGRVLNRRAGGGSTITQQLARHMFEQIGFERRGVRGLARKLKELRVAQDIEAVYGKDEILEAYINQVNYGHGWRGIETAAQNYFGKPAIELDPAEAAMLAAAINAPGRYSPFINPELTRQRRNLVLGLMARQGYLPRHELERWRREPLPTERHGTEVGTIAPYFVEWVRTALEGRYGPNLYNKGLQVYTTLDLEQQRYARAAMDSGWARIEASPAYRGEKLARAVTAPGAGTATETPYIQGAFIALDPATGDVRALIGGRDFRDSKFNRATQALRQAGSTFKPFLYAAAVAHGFTPATVMYDAPLAVDLEDGSVYTPKNYDPDFRGPLTLRDALKFSINTIAVKLGLDVGLEAVAQTAREYGINTPVPPYPSTSIGAPSVIPLELSAAYTVFANAGTWVAPRFIVRVADAQGRTLWETQPTRRQVADPQVAAIVRDLMRTALDNGTGYPARNPAQGNLPYSVPAAGKTGTTNDATDVWFVGFTPNLLATVWFGFDRPRRILPGAAGGQYAGPVWGQFMRQVYFGEPPELPVLPTWEFPEGVAARQIDRRSGKLASDFCAGEVYTEYFVEGTEPNDVCDPYSGAGLFGAPMRRLPTDSVLDTVRIPLQTRPRVPRDTLPVPAPGPRQH